MKTVLKIAIGLAAVAGVVFESHRSQIEKIERECSETQQTIYDTLSPEEEVMVIRKEIRQEITGTKEDLDFVLGDFEVENGKARCGGRARRICEKAAARGFETEIGVERKGLLGHYFAILSKGGEVWEIK